MEEIEVKWSLDHGQRKCIFILDIMMRSVFLCLRVRSFFVLFFSCNLHAEKVDLSLPFPAVFISQRQWLVALDSSTLPVVQVSTRRHRTSTSIPGVPVWKCLIPGWMNTCFAGNCVCQFFLKLPLNSKFRILSDITLYERFPEYRTFFARTARNEINKINC